MQPPVVIDPKGFVRAAERDGQYEIEIAIASRVPFVMRVLGIAYGTVTITTCIAVLGTGLGWMHLSDFVLGSLITTVFGPIVAGLWTLLRPRKERG